jgi:hypothetical protein
LILNFGHCSSESKGNSPLCCSQGAQEGAPWVDDSNDFDPWDDDAFAAAELENLNSERQENLYEEEDIDLGQETFGLSIDKDQIIDDIRELALEEESAYLLEDENGDHNTLLLSSKTSSATSTGDRRQRENYEAALNSTMMASAASPTQQQEDEPEYLHLPRIRPHFQLTEFVANMIRTANNEVPHVYPDDAYLPFDQHAHAADPSRNYPSKMAVIQEMTDILAIHNTTKVGVNAVFGVLQRTTGLNVPVKINPRTGSQIFCWEKYLKHDSRKQFVHVCVNACCAYIGALKEAIKCPNPHCKHPRFRPCCINGSGNCPNGATCDPFTTSHTLRTPYRVMTYRSIIIKLLDLYKKSLVMTDMFTYNDTRVKEDGFITDILDGAVPQKHLEEMKLRFSDRKDQYARDNNGAVLHELSLCLSGFYDGDKLYKRSDDSMWPFLISIMNCDPCFRTTLGLALFMVLNHNMPMGSGGEQTAMDDMLVAELEQLFDGLLFEFQTDSGEKHAVFIQARLIFFHLDTRAQDKVLHVCSAGSMSGCTFCDDCKGLTRPIIGRCVYPGASVFLPENHILKHIGEYEDYDVGYFGEIDTKTNQAIGQKISTAARRIKIKGKGGDADDSEFDDVAGADAEADDVAAENATVRPKKGSTKGMTHTRSRELPSGKMWFSQTYPWRDVAGACWSPYNDPHTRIYTRVQHAEYLHNSLCAGLKMNAYLEDCIRLRKKVAKTAAAKWVQNGVHYPPSAWAFAPPGVTLFENQVPDRMHQAANAGEYTMKLVKGERALDLNSRKLSMAEDCFTFLGDKSNAVPWLASLYSQCLADSVFTCLNLPTWCKRDYKFDLPFHHSGYMNSHQKMVFFSVYVAYIFSFTDISMEYRHFFERDASDSARIASPIIKRSELRDLINHVIETMALREKMTPSSEHAFIFHELIEIVHHLSLFGIIKGMMCFFGERCMHTLAAGVPDGGLGYLITVTARFVAKENSWDHNMISYTENLKKFLNNQGRFSPKVLKLTGPFVEMALNDWVKGVLFDDIADFLVSQEIEGVVLKSPFMRLMWTYAALVEINNGVNERNKRNRVFPSMVEWVRTLYLRYRASSIFGTRVVKDLVMEVVFDEPTDDVFANNKDFMMSEIVDKGKVFMSDFRGIIRDLAQFATAGEHTIAGFTSAIVKGVEMRGRGQLYTETSSGRHAVQKRLFVTQNPKNDLSTNWHQGFQINSWAKVEDWYIAHPNNPAKKQVLPRVLFGQFNYFFRLNIPSDPVIHQLSLANMVLRNVSNPDPARGSHRYINMRAVNTYYHDKQFIVLNYVEATNLALSPLDKNSYPIPNLLTSVKEAVHAIKSYPLKISGVHHTEVSRMYMIELHKERLHIKYGGVVMDKDITKCFEASVEEHHRKRSIAVQC